MILPAAFYANRALEAAGRPERIDHRSYERQGIEKIPSIHMGVAASQMERRDMGVGVAVPLVVECKIGAHPSSYKVVFDE